MRHANADKEVIRRAAGWAICLPILLAAASSADAQEIPPIIYSGQLETSANLVLPEEGDDLLVRNRTLILNGASYIWQPWFSTIEGNFGYTQNITHADGRTQADIFTGGALYRQFPQSRFPFEAFLDANDTRSEVKSGIGTDADFRTVRMGVRQRYRPVDGHWNSVGLLERISQTDTNNDEDVTNRLELQASGSLPNQRYGATSNVISSTRDVSDEERLDVIVTGTHSYQPNVELSIDSFGAVNTLKTENTNRDDRTSSLDLNSEVAWRPVDRPLTATAGAQYQGDVEERGSEKLTTHRTRLRGFADYAFSRQLRVSGGANVDWRGGDVESETATEQNGSVTYTPDAVDLKGFTYNWFTSGSAANRTRSDLTAQTVGAAIGHAANRVLPVNMLGGMRMLFTGNQSYNTNYDTEVDLLQTLNNGLSFTLDRTTARSTNQIRLDGTDTRTWGRDGDTAVTSVTLQGIGNTQFDRFQNVQGNITFQIVNQDSDFGVTGTTETSNADAVYRHQRLFSLPRLRFQSALRFRSDTLVPFSTEENEMNYSWENRLDYSIGLLDVRFDATLAEQDGRQAMTFFLRLVRTFGGVF